MDIFHLPMPQKSQKLDKSFKPLFWSYDFDKLDPEKDKHLIIHQVLALGTMKNLKKLFKIYSKQEVKEEFLRPRPGLYFPPVLKFCQFLLGVEKLDYNNYIKDIHGKLSNLRPKKT